MSNDGDGGRAVGWRAERVGRFSRFPTAMVLIDFLALLVVAPSTPPDPNTQLLAGGPLLLLAPIGAYWLVYRGGFARVRGRGE